MKYLKIVFSTVMLLMIAPVVVLSKGDKSDIPNLRMAVISDTHIGAPGNDDLFRSVLRDYKIIAPEYDVLSVVGDLTTKGLTIEYDLFNKVIREETSPNVEKIFAMGNHEFFEKRYWPYPNLSDAEMIERFVDKMQPYGSIDNVYYDKWIKDYHFIVLGSEAVHPKNWDIPVVTDEQYDWLEETIREDADAEKPIFVFLHQAIDNTIHCSEEWGARFENDRLKEILQQYPQTFLFSGHTHCLVEHPRTVYQDGFTMVGTGAITKNRYYEEGIAPILKSDGLLVNVYDDRVEINGHDFDTKQRNLSYTVNLPYNESEKITDNQPPTFPADRSLTVERLDIETIKLTWDAAVDNTQVDKYVILQNGQYHKTVYVDFWNEESANRQFKAEITKLSYDKDYDYEVIAIDAWGNESTPIQVKLPSISQIGWVPINTTWYYINPETNELATRWLFLKGEWYFFNNDGSMRTGWLSEGPVSYYLTDDGTLAKGWSAIDHHWYHFSSNTGVMTTGWHVEKGEKYYLNEDGTMAKGWNNLQGKWYYMDSSGAMATGWLQKSGKWYYLDSNGMMKTGWLSIGSLQYYLNHNGHMVTGWLHENDDWFFMNASGALTKGWLLNSGKWYHLDHNGKIDTGWTKVNNIWYHFNSSGTMTTGWQFENGNWYYLNQNGAMKTGWLKLGSNWHYLLPGGQMATDWILLDDIWYYLDANGVWNEGV